MFQYNLIGKTAVSVRFIIEIHYIPCFSICGYRQINSVLPNFINGKNGKCAKSVHNGPTVAETVWRVEEWFNYNCCHTVRCHYSSSLTNIHNRHPLACPLGRGMGCLLWSQHLIDILPQVLSSIWHSSNTGSPSQQSEQTSILLGPGHFVWPSFLFWIHRIRWGCG